MDELLQIPLQLEFRDEVVDVVLGINLKAVQDAFVADCEVDFLLVLGECRSVGVRMVVQVDHLDRHWPLVGDLCALVDLAVEASSQEVPGIIKVATYLAIPLELDAVETFHGDDCLNYL